jgi:hypothetical protein
MACLAASIKGMSVDDTGSWPDAWLEPVHPRVTLWILKASQLTEFSRAVLLLGVRFAVRQDDAACFKMLRAYWTSLDTPLH